MKCSIIREENNIVEVLAENGRPSILFNTINENPLIENKEQGLEAYKNIFVPDLNITPHPIKTDVNGEPLLYYRTPTGEIYSDYSEALNATQAGDIQGVIITSDNISYDPDSKADVVVTNQVKANDNAVTALFTVDANSNPETLQGFVNQQVRLGYLNGRKRLTDGEYQLQGAGEALATSIANSRLAAIEAMKAFGTQNVQRNTDGTIQITVNNNLVYTGGEMSKEDFVRNLKEGKQSYLENLMGREVVTGYAYRIYREKNSLYRDGKPANEPINTLSENQLVKSLKSFLSKIGVNTTSIENYIEQYADKNRVEPNANALADIANKVVAFSQGEISVENLSEETAHFAIEAYQDTETLQRMLDNVHNLPEWAEAQRYLAVYGKKYEGAELDNIVRREILGKVLARKLQERFDDSQSTGVETGFTALLRDLWANFIARIRNFITPSIRTELDGFTDAIANNILTDNFDDIFSESNLDKSDFLFYSLEDKKVTSRIQAYYNSLQKINSGLKKNKSGNIDISLAKAKELLKNSNELSTVESWNTIQQLNAGLYIPLNKLSRIVEDARKKLEKGDTNQGKMYLDGETTQAINNLAEIEPALQDIIAVIENNVLKEIEAVNKKVLLQDIRAKIEAINELKRQERFFNRDATDNTIDTVIAKANLSPDVEGLVRSQIRTAAEQETKDITWFTRTFGQTRLSNNPFLNLMGKIFSDNRINSLRKTQADIAPIVQHAAENGFNLNDYRDISETDSKGNPTGYLTSAVRMSDFLQDLTDVSVALIRDKLQLDPKMSENSVLKRVVDLNQLQKEDYNKEVNDWLNANRERQFVDTYYERREAETAWLSPETKEIQKQWSNRRFAITNKYRRNAGTYSDSDVLELADIARERKFAKSLYNDDGSQKEEGTTEYIIAQDLIRADEEFSKKERVFSLKSGFIENLDALEEPATTQANKNSLKWIEANGGIRYTKEFFDALGTKSEDGERNKEPKVVKKLRDILPDLDDSDSQKVEDLADNIEDKLNQRSDILRKYQKAGNPAEVEASAMSETAKDRIRTLDTELQKAFLEVNAVLRKNNLQSVEPSQVETENTANQAYYEDLADTGITASQRGTYFERDFVLENVSADDKVNVQKFSRKITDLRGGFTENIEPKYKRFFVSYFGLDSEISDEDLVYEVNSRLLSPEFRDNEKIVIDFAKTKMFSYYKRFAPKGYSEFLQDLTDGVIKPSRLLTDRANLEAQYPVVKYVEITPSYTWNDDSNVNADEINPNFDPDWEQGIYQPKISKYRNDEYFDKFAPDANGEATLNKSKFEMIRILQNANRVIYDNYNLERNINKFPQISKSGVEKLVEGYRVGIGETVTRSFRDVFANRIDDQDYGAENDGSPVIPIKYVYDLEERTDVSLDLPFTFAEALYESNLYKQKKASLEEVMSLRQTIEEQKFTGGKTGKDTNSLKMAESIIEFNIYGKTQSRKLEIDVLGRKIDVSRLALVLYKTLQWNSLAFSPIIGATNFTTGILNKNLEGYLGQFLTGGSLAYAEREFDLVEAPKLVADTGKMNRESKVYKLLEAGGVIDLRNRLQGSSLGRVGVALNNIGWDLYFIGDVTIKGKVFIATMDDMRGVEGTFMAYNQYRLRPENEGLTKSQIKDKWEAYRENSLWNILENNENKPLSFKQSAIDTYGKEALEQLFKNTLQKSSQTAASVDGQISETEKSAASRDFLLRFTTGSRSFLFSGLQTRLQGRKANLQQNAIVEGQYITAGNYANNIVKKLLQDKSLVNLVSAVRGEWGGLDDAGRYNMKRTLAEFALATALIGISMLALGGMGDDDKDNYLTTLASYVLLRTTSEMNSQLPSGFTENVIGVLDSPIMAIGFIKEVYKGGYFEDVGEGSPYAGMNKLTALAIKKSVLKNLYTMSNIQETRDNYRIFNSGTLGFLSTDKKLEEFYQNFQPEN